MKSIGKYEVIEEIGASPAGTTYRARDTFRKRELALKDLHSIPELDTSSKESFYRLLSICADLTHRHLAKIVDIGEVDGRIYIATELLSGSDLRTLIAGGRELTMVQKAGILAQVCEGLAFAHSRQIVHGDLKPSNIFVDANNDVTILDMATAKWQSLLLAAGGPAGPIPHYLAPEQILGQPVDAKADLFSLAIIAYEFISGRYPFQVPVSLIPREIVHSEPESLRKLNPNIPEELEQLLARALKKNPEERIQTAEEFAAGLYGIAQLLRRPAPAPAAEPVSAASETPAPIETKLPADARESAPLPRPPEPEVKTPRRQDVQAASNEQPWTARSYVANPAGRDERGPLPPPPFAASEPAPPTPMPEPPQAPPPMPRNVSFAPPLRAPSLAPPMNPAAPLPLIPPVRKNGKRTPHSLIQAKPLKRRVIAVALGGVLAIYVIVNYVAHQGLRASQSAIAKSSAVTSPKGGVSDLRRNERGSVAQPVADPAPDVPANLEPAQPEPRLESKTETKSEARADQILRKQVKASWESGNYAEAMRLVDQVLEASPGNSEARGWKKRIRAAQEAEAAIR